MISPCCEFETIDAAEFERLVACEAGFDSLENFYNSVSSHEWIYSTGCIKEILRLFKLHYPKEFKEILNRAELVSKNHFDIFGNGPTFLGTKIDWHLDFKSGRIWKKDFYLNVPHMFWGDYSDARVPWELSRFHYLVDLAIAYNYTGLQRYIHKFASLLEDWIYDNPCAYGINWANSKEAAIRAMNWIASYELFDPKILSSDFKSRFFQALYQHGDFIMRNSATYSPSAGNDHYFYDLLGLLVLGRLFYQLPSGKVWHQFARDKLENEIQAQISPDGICYESSLNYQLVILELSLFAAHFERRFRASFSDKFKAGLRQGCTAIYKLSKPDQTIPNFGDSGSDKLFRLVDRDERDISYFLDLASVIIDFKNCSTSKIRPEPEVLWWTGIDGFNAYFNKIVSPRKKKGSHYFPTSGLAVMRGRNIYLGFFADSASHAGFGAHKHNDIFSIEFAYGRDNFLVDSGTYIYTGDPAGRNYFRKTSSHSTLEVDGQEINRFLPKILFSVRKDAEINGIRWKSEDDFDFISAEHSGYTRLENPIIVKRSLYFDKIREILLFRDEFLGSGKHLFSGSLILDHQIKAGMLENCVILKAPSGKLAVIVMANRDWYLEKIPHYISTSYGNKQESWKIRYHKLDKAPQACLWGMFAANSIAQIETKIAAYYAILKSLGWQTGLPGKLILKKGAEQQISQTDIQRLLRPGICQLDKKGRAYVVADTVGSSGAVPKDE